MNSNLVEGFMCFIVGIVCGSLVVATIPMQWMQKKATCEQALWWQMGYMASQEHNPAWQQFQKDSERFEKTGEFIVNGKCYKGNADGQIVRCAK